MERNISGLAATLGAAAISLIGVGAASATVINFDDVVGGTSILSPTDVSTHYAGLGVTFADPGGSSGAVLASAPVDPTTSLPNVFFANQHQGSDAGDLQINFSAGTNDVGLDVFLSSGYYLTYAAYGSAGLLTSGVLPTTTFYAEPQHLSLASGALIDQLVLTSHPGSDPSYFGNFALDNLSFGGAVPEPATWAMMLAGFGGLGAIMRRRRTAIA